MTGEGQNQNRIVDPPPVANLPATENSKSKQASSQVSPETERAIDLPPTCRSSVFVCRTKTKGEKERTQRQYNCYYKRVN